MNLIIVESPTKARTLSRFLGSEYIIDPTMGHVRDLPKSRLGVDTEHDFSVEYAPVARAGAAVSKIQLDAKQADKVYLATDPDREGEAIAFHVHEMLNLKFKISNFKFGRIVFHEITQTAVKDALASPRGLNMPLVEAQEARRVLDRLVGYKLSPLLWKKVRVGLSAGRVQSVAVRLVVDREREIEAFVPQEYWEVFAQLKTQNSILKTEQELIVKLVKIGENKAEIKNKEQAEGIVTDLQVAQYRVKSVESKEVIKRPYAPFTTSTMTQAAGRLYFWSAKRTMSVAQKLYEEGLITYHRTDSTFLSTQALNNARDYIAKEFAKEYLPLKPRMYKTSSKLAQEAHEAIRPTTVEITNDKLQMLNELGKDAKTLYDLIWKRFVASQMADSVYDETTVNVIAAPASRHPSYTLQATGQVMRFDGWRVIYIKAPADTAEQALQLPEVAEGEALQLVKVDAQQKFSQAPARYTEATLIKTLEKLGIGRPSTYAPTISTIQDRQYVEKIEGKFQSTALGVAVNDFLVANFPDIVDYSFTAHMEGDLDEIAKGQKEWKPVIRDFWQPFSKKLEGVEKSAKRVQIQVEHTGNKCPKCKVGEEVIRVGRFGKFLSCSRFPDCDWKDTYVEKLGIKCPECKRGDVVVKKSHKGKRFYGCSRYPECKWASWKKPDGEKQLIERQRQ